MGLHPPHSGAAGLPRHLEPVAVGLPRSVPSPGQFLANRIPFGGEPLLRVPKGTTHPEPSVVLIHASPGGLVCIFCLFEIAQSSAAAAAFYSRMEYRDSINEKGGGVS